MRIGEIFDSNDAVSRWVIQFYSISNDLLFTNSKIEQHSKQEEHSALSLYFFKLASSHLKEAVDFFKDSMQYKEITDFISMFNCKDQEDFNELLMIFDTEEEQRTYTNLNSFRNNSFHYPKLDNKDLKQVLKKVKNYDLELFELIEGTERALFLT
ncbi:hypothetical protein [Paenibacillus sp. URB8-2]|uniref:hypothetical protein n=1 Tax=Paenibacillus sp. URB8-2 TaxID=2741301 RepID=UPI0015B82767|nr:hypothetical protein [Paenibacillus sp. URB8-2]BCG60806.1 hypothetical protein PUR_42310 [Paenibacillus sp. URB8-2]